MKRLLNILKVVNQPLNRKNNNIQDSKHSPVYRKRDVEGFASLFSFFFVNLNKAGSNMKLLIRLFVFILSVASLSTETNAQIKGIISYADFDEDNAIIGDTTTITIVSKFVSSVTNADTSVTGSVFFRYKTNWSIDWNNSWSGIIDDSVTGSQNVPLGYSIYDTKLPVPNDTNIFRSGPPINVIIIWPAFYSPSIAYIDSADYIIPNQQVYVGLLEEPIQKFGSTVFPNPAEGIQLVMFNSKYSQEINEVTITNTLGQIIHVKSFTDDEGSHGFVLPTENLQSGIYHVHIVYKDRKREVVKFIKN